MLDLLDLLLGISHLSLYLSFAVGLIVACSACNYAERICKDKGIRGPTCWAIACLMFPPLVLLLMSEAPKPAP